MAVDPTIQLFLGAIALGAIHGAEPGHGWPVAATYAMEKPHRWLSGVAASTILGVGHLISSITMVVVFFAAKSYFSLTQVNEPLSVLGVAVGGPVDLVAGALLIVLGIREYRHGHSHGHGGPASDDGGHGHGVGSHSHDHGEHTDDHGDADHSHGAGSAVAGVQVADVSERTDGASGHNHGGDEPPHDHEGHGHSHDGGVLSRLASLVPGVDLSSDPGTAEEAAERGLWGIAGFAFLLGFAHEEEFEIIALCLGSPFCLELMLAYALTVVVALVGLTVLLIAGYERYEERVSRYAEHFPTVSAVVLVVMGAGFVAGLF